MDAAYTQLSSTQDRSPHEQVAGAAILLVSYAQLLGIDISELVGMALRMRKDADMGTFAPEVRALDEYIRNEIRK